MKSLHILVVDDSADTREIVCQMLDALGHRARGVEDAEQALQAASTDVFDILITDLSLPTLSGLELARQLRLTDPKIRIILCTGHKLSLLRVHDVADAILDKPFDFDSLAQVLCRVATQARAAS